MDLKTLLLDLYLHMEWADAEIWRVVLDSEAALADEELMTNLHHIHLVHHAYFDIWHGNEVDRYAGSELKGTELAAWAQEQYPRLWSYLDPLSNDDLEAAVKIPWAEHMAQGPEFDASNTPFHVTAIQVCLHTTHHRAQAATQLRRLGLTPPVTDYIVWTWHSRPKANWPI